MSIPDSEIDIRCIRTLLCEIALGAVRTFMVVACAAGLTAGVLSNRLHAQTNAIQAVSDQAGKVAAEDCIIEPEQVVRLATPVVGVIARVDVDRGDIVRKGQVLAKLEDGVEVALLALARTRASNDSAIRSAEARLKFQNAKLGRLSSLQSKSIGSLADLQQAEAEAQVAEQQVKEAVHNREVARLEVLHAEEIVKQRTLRSPIDGIVVERTLVPGEYRNEQSAVFTLAKIDQLRVEVIVPLSRYADIQVGSRVEVRPEAPVGGAYVATVSVVDRVFDSASGTFGVRLMLPNSNLLLPSGVRCKVKFDATGR